MRIFHLEEREILTYQFGVRRNVRIFFGCLISGLLVACSGSEDAEPSASQFEKGKMIDLNSNNVFAWNPEDVQRGENNEITGGKRSQYDRRANAAFGKNGSSAPAYLSKSYHAKAWTGKKDYSKGSYKTEDWKGGKRSRFSSLTSREAGKTSRSSGKRFQTNGYRVGAARESQTSGVSSQASHYGSRRYGRKLQIFSQDDNRQMSLEQSRSLLGKQ